MYFKKNNLHIKIAVIGLGYVGLPLMYEFYKKYFTIGFDLNLDRINNLKNNFDVTKEVSKSNLKKINKKNFTNDFNFIKDCNVYIVTVPTPIKKKNIPDLSNLELATKNISSVLKKNDIVIYESTVYPGVVEEFCGKLLEKYSGLFLNKDFYLGYSPERMNPGDKLHNVRNIVKITSGSNKKSALFVDKLYKSIVIAGTYKTSSIKIAEAAKVIENTQRDINIAFMNELSIIFNKLNIDTNEVLKAASTKWNFINFKPGLVGGHCIGIDPYYLTYKAKKIGINPKIILAGRKINNSMPLIISNNIVNSLNKKKYKSNKRILIMGIAFKENCPDIRNSKVINIYKNLIIKNFDVDLFDPIVNSKELKNTYNLSLITKVQKNYYDCVLLAVPHDCFKKIGIKKIKNFMKKDAIFYDIKSLFHKKYSNMRL